MRRAGGLLPRNIRRVVGCHLTRGPDYFETIRTGRQWSQRHGSVDLQRWPKKLRSWHKRISHNFPQSHGAGVYFQGPGSPAGPAAVLYEMLSIRFVSSAFVFQVGLGASVHGKLNVIGCPLASAGGVRSYFCRRCFRANT